MEKINAEEIAVWWKAQRWLTEIYELDAALKMQMYLREREAEIKRDTNTTRAIDEL